MKVVIVIAIVAITTSFAYSASSTRFEHWRQDSWDGGAGQETTTDLTTTKFSYGEAILTPASYLAAGIEWEEIVAIDGVSSVYNVLETHNGTYIAATKNPSEAPYTGRLYASVLDINWNIIDWVDLGRIHSSEVHDDNIIVDATALEDTFMNNLGGRIFVGCTNSDDKATIYYIGQNEQENYTDIPTFTNWEYISLANELILFSHSISRFNAIDSFEFGGIFGGTSSNGKIVYFTDFFAGIPMLYVEQLDKIDHIYNFYTIAEDGRYALTGKSAGETKSKALFNYYHNFEPTEGADWEVAFELEGVDSIRDMYTFGNYAYVGTENESAIFRSPNRFDWEKKETFPPNIGNILCLGHVGNLIIAGTDNGLVIASFDNGVTWAVAGEFLPNEKVYSIMDMAPYSDQTFITCGDENGAMYSGSIPNDYPVNYSMLVSSAFDTASTDANYGNVSWNVDNNGGEIHVKVRSFDDKTQAEDWLNIDPIPNGKSLNDYDYVSKGDRYIQYQIAIEPGDSGETPVLDWIDIEIGNLGYDSLLPDNEIVISPNPVNGNICRVYYALSADSWVGVSLFDVKGRLVFQKETDGEAFIKNPPVLLDIADVAPGVYMVVVEAQSESGTYDAVTKKVAVLR